MFEMFETYGKQITSFINESKTLLEAMRTEIGELRKENAEFKAQITRIEGAHMLLMEWLAEIDEDEAAELATIASDAAAESTAAAEVAVAAAVEVAQTTEETPVTEVTPPAEETPAEIPAESPVETPPQGLPETPVPEEPASPPEEQPLRKSKRRWI
jgi:hypothetical protein